MSKVKNGTSQLTPKLNEMTQLEVSSNQNSASYKKEGVKGITMPDFERLVTQDKITTDPQSQVANQEMEATIRELLLGLGEDPERDGLKDTPGRVRRSLAFLTDGYGKDIHEVLGTAIFEETYDEMVLVRDIEMYSMCEHHMLPFYGKCHIAYIPNGKIVGLSKLPRIVDVFSRRLQVQERMTTQIAHALDELLQPHGVAVVTEAYHLCMMMRGVQKQNSSTVASCMLGAFREDSKTRQEFLNLVQTTRNL